MIAGYKRKEDVKDELNAQSWFEKIEKLKRIWHYESSFRDPTCLMNQLVRESYLSIHTPH